MAEEPIGEIPILITGNYSALLADLDAAVKMAEAGANNIAAAFSAGSSGAGEFSATIQQIGFALGQVIEAISINTEGLMANTAALGSRAAAEEVSASASAASSAALASNTAALGGSTAALNANAATAAASGQATAQLAASMTAVSSAVGSQTAAMATGTAALGANTSAMASNTAALATNTAAIQASAQAAALLSSSLASVGTAMAALGLYIEANTGALVANTAAIQAQSAAALAGAQGTAQLAMAMGGVSSAIAAQTAALANNAALLGANTAATAANTAAMGASAAAAGQAATATTSAGQAAGAASGGFLRLYTALFLVRIAWQAFDSLRRVPEDLKNLSEATGVSVERLAELQGAIDRTGGDGEKFGQVIARLARANAEMGRGNQQMADDFRRLGITATDPIEQLHQLADSYSHVIEKTEFLGIAERLTGRNSQELAGILARGSEKLRRNEAASADWARAMADTGTAADQMTRIIAEMSQKMAGDFARNTELLTRALQFLAGGLVTVETAALMFFQVIVRMGAGLKEDLAGNFEAAGEQIRALGEDLKQDVISLDDFMDRMKDLRDEMGKKPAAGLSDTLKEIAASGEAGAKRIADALEKTQKQADAMGMAAIIEPPPSPEEPNMRHIPAPDTGEARRAQEEILSSAADHSERLLKQDRARVESQLAIQLGLDTAFIQGIENRSVREAALAAEEIEIAQRRQVAISALGKQELDTAIGYLRAKQSLEIADGKNALVEIAHTNAEILALEDRYAADKLKLQEDVDKAQGKAMEAALKARREMTQGALSAFNIQPLDVSQLIGDLQLLNDAFQANMITLQQLQDAYAKFYARMEELAEGPGLDAAIKEFEHGLITQKQLLDALNNAKVAEKRRQFEEEFKKTGNVELLRQGQQQYERGIHPLATGAEQLRRQELNQFFLSPARQAPSPTQTTSPTAPPIVPPPGPPLALAPPAMQFLLRPELPQAVAPSFLPSPGVQAPSRPGGQMASLTVNVNGAGWLESHSVRRLIEQVARELKPAMGFAG